MQWERKTVNGRVLGAQRSYGDSRVHYPMPGGRWINAADEEQRRRVVFLGDELATDIFGKVDPVGKTVLINSAPYTVIGVMQKKTQMGVYGGPDKDHAVIPYTTFRAQFGRDRLNVLVIQTREPEEMTGALKRVNEILGKKYGYDPTDDRAFGTWDMVKTSKQMRMMIVGIQMFLGIVGALTLIIGGVGVANIMYAVVKERTREIGVKMALGAKVRQVMAPFVMEALLMTVAGGLLGTAVSLALMGIIAVLPLKGDAFDFLGRPTFSPAIAFATAAILGTVGLLAGYFPARRAASVNPAVSLRYE
jgi:putative ABC transport system permease protein